MDDGEDMRALLNEALEDIIFKFVKIGESELKLADDLKDALRQTREALASNFDPKDPEFITLKEALERLFKQKKLSEVTQEEMTQNIGILTEIYAKIRELNRKNNLIRDKYQGDAKFVRIHKRLFEHGDLTQTERIIHSALVKVKTDADEKVWQATDMLNNDAYFSKLMMGNIINRFESEKLPLNVEVSKYINNLVVQEYLNEFNGVTPW